MIQFTPFLTGLIQGLRRVIARAAPVVSAPARPIWAGPELRLRRDNQRENARRSR